jgi:tRNA-dihydrouridine synthase
MSQSLAWRESLAKGVWPWAERTLLAPMEGVTHPGFRTLISSYGGVGVVCTEFVRITATPLNRRLVQEQVVRSPAALLSVQVMGNDAANMALATEWVVSAGTDIVDINLGCPAPNAVRKGVGAAMLQRPEVLTAVVRAMRARTPGLLSAKMRAGVTVTDGAVDTARLLEAAGVDFITVHPRRSVDHYLGRADHRIIALIKRNVRVPVVGNGDLWYASQALELMHSTGCDAVMIGRPALRNPWIFTQIGALLRGEPVPQPDGNALLAHVEAYLQATNTDHEGALLGLLKEQLRYLLRALPAPGPFMREVLREASLSGIRSRLRSRLEGLPASALDLGPLPTAPSGSLPAPALAQPISGVASEIAEVGVSEATKVPSGAC